FSSLLLQSTFPPRHLHSFPTRRSSDLNSDANSTLFVPTRSSGAFSHTQPPCMFIETMTIGNAAASRSLSLIESKIVCVPPPLAPDRKSTRLNSSHVSISYAVFCLKKKI